MTRICVIVAASYLCLAMATVTGADPIRWRLLSDNRGYQGPALQTGVTYEWGWPPDNPGDVIPGTDKPGRRLLDGELPTSNWHTTVGFNWHGKDNWVTFDFKQRYAFAKVRLCFFRTLPKYVEVLGAGELAADDEQTQWTSLGKLGDVQPGWNEILLPDMPQARYLKLLLKLEPGQTCLREVQIIGTKPNEAAPQPPPVKRRGGKLVLAEAGRAYCSVVADENGSQQAVNAAWMLKNALEAMTGAEIPIFDVRERPGGARLVVGNNALARRLGVDVAQQYPGAEGFVIKTVGDDIVLAGNEAGSYQGTQDAVAQFLRTLGCGWFAEDPLWQPIPKRNVVAVAPLDIVSHPAISMRHIWYVPKAVARNWGLGGDQVASAHNQLYMFPPKQYFAEHPEYYALIDGKRTAEGEWQLCTTNPEVIALTVEKARQAFDKNPNLVAFSLTNNDCGGFCQCPKCQAVRKGEGNPNARAMLAYANAVARGLRKTHPDARVCFLAYWYTQAAPGPDMKAEPGVVVMVVDEGCKAHALDDPACERNAKWCRNFQAWAATGAEMAIYEWYIPGCSDKRWLKLPWVSGEAAVRNIRWWIAHGVKWITYESQASYSPALPLGWPLYYVAARAMWDPSLSARQILAEACHSLYGPAAEEMLAYYLTLEHAVSNTKLHSTIWALPDPAQIYDEQVQAQCRKHLARALAAAAGAPDPKVWQRVSAEVQNWRLAEQTLNPPGE